MRPRRPMLVWLPRSLAILFTLFISLFAIDAIEKGESFFQKAIALFGHMIPSLLCVLVVVWAWKREWIGAIAFIVLGAMYTWWAWDHPQWILVIALPLYAIGVFYTIVWRERGKAGPTIV